jgi:hypothetical protein
MAASSMPHSVVAPESGARPPSAADDAVRLVADVAVESIQKTLAIGVTG